MSEPAFLTLEQIQYLHRLSLEAHGGQDGLRDPAAFASAVVQPHNTWHYAQGDLFDVAAAYAYHLAESQAFIDGNKRTGMSACARVFEDKRCHDSRSDRTVSPSDDPNRQT